MNLKIFTFCLDRFGCSWTNESRPGNYCTWIENSDLRILHSNNAQNWFSDSKGVRIRYEGSCRSVVQGIYCYNCINAFIF
jgi:hypothetical protein